jgi:hypothetical protein
MEFSLVFLFFEDFILLFELVLIFELSTILPNRLILLLFIINWGTIQFIEYVYYLMFSALIIRVSNVLKIHEIRVIFVYVQIRLH